MHERGPAMVRIALLSLLFGAFALCLVQPVQAGTAEAPEVQDGRFDVTGPGGSPACTGPLPSNPASAGACLPPAGFADLVSGWVASETATGITLMIDSANNANVYGAAKYEFHFTVGGTAYVATFNVAQASPGGNGAVTPGGVAATAEFVDTVMVLTVPKASIGNPVAGDTMTALFLTSANQVYTDRAPNSGNGQDYLFGVGAGNSTLPGDTDNDMLNDTCEMEFYEDLNGTNNASADDDGDGLTNGQECAANPRTDPTNSDTDGDGVNDKDDPYPADATQGGASGTATSTSTGTGTGGGTGTGTSTNTGPSSTASDTGTATSDEADSEVKDFGDAVEKLQSDLDYLGTSAGGMVAVLILAILALAVRWSL